MTTTEDHDWKSTFRHNIRPVLEIDKSYLQSQDQFYTNCDNTVEKLGHAIMDTFTSIDLQQVTICEPALYILLPLIGMKKLKTTAHCQQTNGLLNVTTALQWQSCFIM